MSAPRETYHSLLRRLHDELDQAIERKLDLAPRWSRARGQVRDLERRILDVRRLRAERLQERR